MPQYRVMFARFPYGNVECSESTDWLIASVHKAKTDPRISEVIGKKYNDTPITHIRNRAMKEARELGCDYVYMIDSDQAPDIAYPGYKPFFDSSFDFALNHRDKPCIIAAPYCGPAPRELPYMFHWRNGQSGNPNADFELGLMTREEAAIRGGFEEVAAMPTGLILIDVRVLDYIDPPWFEYEYVDPPFNTRKATTEDVWFTRNCSLAGIPCYAAWDSWAGHNKNKLVGKPELLKVDDVRQCFRDALLRNQRSDEKLVEIGAGKNGNAVRPRFQNVQGLWNSEGGHSGELQAEQLEQIGKLGKNLQEVQVGKR